jgi:UrcA family protein
MKKLTTMIAVASFALSIGTIAHANPAGEFRSETVKYADLNTTSDQGAAVLFHRLTNAAKNVCRDLGPGRSLGLMSAYNNCIHKALSNAVADVDRPAVSAYAAARGVAPSESTGIRIARSN